MNSKSDANSNDDGLKQVEKKFCQHVEYSHKKSQASTSSLGHVIHGEVTKATNYQQLLDHITLTNILADALRDKQLDSENLDLSAGVDQSPDLDYVHADYFKDFGDLFDDEDLS